MGSLDDKLCNQDLFKATIITPTKKTIMHAKRKAEERRSNAKAKLNEQAAKASENAEHIMKEMNPICICGAGPCLIEECDKKPNEGRQYYVCHIEREQGACYHFQWCNSSNIEVYPGSMNDD